MKKLTLKIKKLDIGFNQKLYLDGIRQLRLVGIMGLVILCAAAFLTATGYHIDSIRYDSFGNLIERVPTGVTLFQCHWALFLTFPVLVPVMTMMLFSFLNQRNSSDFYHAIPDTRGTLYISYAASILTWVGVIIGISTLVSVFSISILPAYYVIWSGVAKALFLIVAACVLVMGGIMIALGLTGTRMSNLLVSLIILFLPRVFVTVVMYILEDMMPFVAWEYSPSLFNPRYNLISGIPLALFSEVNPFAFWGSGVYSLLLGIIYLAVGYVIFLRRKSESAAHAAITPKMQSAFRLIISLTVCLLPMYFITQGWADVSSLDISTLFVIVVFYVISVFAYFIYELMTTGKLRGFRKLCRGIGLLAALNVVLFLIIIGIYSVTVKDMPEGEDIDYVMLCGDDDDYFEAQLQQIRIRDDEVAEITADALKRAITRYAWTGNYGYGYDLGGGYVETVHKTVAINVGWRTIYRDVIYTDAEWSVIADCLSQQPEYYQAYCDLPEFNVREMSIHCENGYFQVEQIILIYEQMREEVKELNFEEWYSAVANYSYGNCLDTICISLNVGNTDKRDTIRLPILFSMTDTVNVYLREINKNDLNDDILTEWNVLYDLVDGKTEDGVIGSSLNINLSLSMIGDGWSFNGIEGFLYGFMGEKGWENGYEGIAKPQESYLTFVNKLFSGEYSSDQETAMWLVVDVYAYGDGYTEAGEWITHDISQKFCIALSKPLPEEIEDILGDYLEKYMTDKSVQ